MKRSIGITLSAVASIFGSLLLLALGGLTLVTGITQRADPAMNSAARVGALFSGLFTLAFATWGIVTAVGLLRLRPWARWSILIFSATLATLAGLGGFMILLIPLPSPPSVSQGMMTAIRWGFAAFYGLLVLIGASWLYFFNKPKVKAQFAAGSASAGPPKRPLSITVIGVYLLIGGVGCAVVGFFPLPAAVLGLILSGWPAHLIYLALGILQLGLSVGLLRLWPLARWIAIGYFLFGAMHSLLVVVLPGFAQRAAVAMTIGDPTTPPLPGFDPARYMLITVIFAALFSAVPIWFLVKSKAAFTREPGA
jgi:hypothetical protein